jgi:hypothetical protein
MARSRKLLLLGAAALAAGVLLKRDKVAGLLPSRSEPYSPPAPGGPGPFPAGPSNYDAPGPVANTATPVPAPEGQHPAAIDEAAEEAAAAAEAANIGGGVSDYAGPEGERAEEEYRPLAEAGEGEAEGQEQAEFELEQAAQPTAPGMSDEQRLIEETMDQAANPFAGETVEPAAPVQEPSAEPEPTGWAPAEPEPPTPAAPDQPTEPPAGQDVPPQGDEPAPFEEGKGEEGRDWRTWSGRSINP